MNGDLAGKLSSDETDLIPESIVRFMNEMDVEKLIELKGALRQLLLVLNPEKSNGLQVRV